MKVGNRLLLAILCPIISDCVIYEWSPRDWIEIAGSNEVCSDTGILFNRPVHVLLSRFYPDFILILSKFYPDKIRIKSG